MAEGDDDDDGMSCLTKRCIRVCARDGTRCQPEKGRKKKEEKGICTKGPQGSIVESGEGMCEGRHKLVQAAACP